MQSVHKYNSSGHHLWQRTRALEQLVAGTSFESAVHWKHNIGTMSSSLCSESVTEHIMYSGGICKQFT
jgi:hypothetical protein